MQFSKDVLAEGLDSLASDDLLADGGLDNDLEHLALDVLLELGDPLAAEAFDLGQVDDAGDGVDGLLVDEELELDEAALAPAGVFVVEGGVTLGRALELAEQVVD